MQNHYLRVLNATAGTRRISDIQRMLLFFVGMYKILVLATSKACICSRVGLCEREKVHGRLVELARVGKRLRTATCR